MKKITHTYAKNTFAVLLLLNCLFVPSFLQAQKQYSLSGSITTGGSGQPIEMATVVLRETNQWTTSTKKGVFSITNIRQGEYTLNVSCIGYKPLEQKIQITNDNSHIEIELDILSFSLNEVLVTATEREEIASTSSINKTAMRHLQPASVAELLQLMPGGAPTQLNFSRTSQISIRQVGSDINTNLGLLVVVDGVPLSNDLNRQLPAGGSSDIKTSGRYSQGRGVDLRELSTDEIEKIEIVRGISSAEYGDMTSGMIKITRKAGKTPTSLRLKSNANQKLFSLGKGWKLKNGAKYNIGGDYLLYKADPRNDLTSYQRITFSSRYSQQFEKKKGVLNVSSFLDYTGTLDKEKDDKDQEFPDDKYSSSYQKISGKFELGWKPHLETDWSFHTNISAFYSHDELIRARAVSLKGPTPSFNSLTEGRHEAQYLPSSYYTEHRVDGKPLRLNALFKSRKKYHLLHAMHNLAFGANYSFSKNYGNGQVFDINAPLFYESAARPYSYHAIPATQKLALFAESNQHYNIGHHILKLQAGLRISQMLNLDQQYAMQNKWYPDPRLNLSWKLPLLGTSTHLTLYGAYGWHTKFPVSAHLFRNPSYYDVSELNYYSQNPNLRSLHILTKIIEPVNYSLQPAVNKKAEIGLKFSFGRTNLDVTLFHESCNNGFDNQRHYEWYNYRRYDYSGIDTDKLTAPPRVADMPYELRNTYLSYSTTSNLKKIEKKGVEYVFSFPRWESIATRISISGAWFRSNYDIEGERLYKPSTIILGESYPYIGVYDYDGGNTKEQLTSKIHFDTNITKFRLVFSNQFYVRWYYSRQKNFDIGRPIAYIDNTGERHSFDPNDLPDPLLKELLETHPSDYFDPDITPVYFSMNQKITKMIKSNIRISFYVNSLFAYQPEYTSNSGATIKNYYRPNFGAEINIKL